MMLKIHFLFIQFLTKYYGDIFYLDDADGSYIYIYIYIYIYFIITN